jgi:hypothetical protein
LDHSVSNDRTIVILILITLLIPISAMVFCSDEEGMTGIVSDVRETKSGHVFEITVPDGTRIKCFTDGPTPGLGRTVTVYGSFSDDGGIFFTDKVVEH